MRTRHRLDVRGLVQGVGFRPFVLRLAGDLELVGLVRNNGRGVVIEIEGEAASVRSFETRLHVDAPAAAQITRCEVEAAPLLDQETELAVLPSANHGERASCLTPDRWVCPDCLRELADPADRRHRYPFIGCTQCGPRATIAVDMPFDRDRTTMAVFPLCGVCTREYGDPADRRCHAQVLACPTCGPHAWFSVAGEPGGDARAPDATDSQLAIARARELLEAGLVVAIKGVGGFHLAVNGRDRAAVERLRAKKRRSRKPLAIMVQSVAVARELAEIDEAIEALLSSPSAPIVLAPARPGVAELGWLAPGLRDLGLMLPYSPLHHLLVEEPLDVLVMTSGNAPGEPITKDNHDAHMHLPADGFVLHNREIHAASDDTVLRTTPVGPVLVRRSRGYVPAPLKAGHLPLRCVLAVGAHLKVTLATLCRGELTVGRHLGDLDNPRAEAGFREELHRVLGGTDVAPEVVAVDLHPDLYSRQHTERVLGHLPTVPIQHHHAHMCSVLAEHRVPMDVQATGIVLDGLGFGQDGTVWGGEVLVGGYAGYHRLGSLRPIPQPGGDRAAREPARMATSLLVDAGLGEDGRPGFDGRYADICSVRSVSPLTSSAGRLFDGVAAILGVAPEIQEYEGEAAARLESVADPAHTDAYALPVAGQQLDTRQLVVALVEDRSPLPVRAARFHNALAAGFAELALGAGTDLIVLGGGCFVNRMLLGRLVARLEGKKRDVRWPRRLPPGDGGLSAGQAAAAACCPEARR